MLDACENINGINFHVILTCLSERIFSTHTPLTFNGLSEDNSRVLDPKNWTNDTNLAGTVMLVPYEIPLSTKSLPQPQQNSDCFGSRGTHTHTHTSWLILPGAHKCQRLGLFWWVFADDSHDDVFFKFDILWDAIISYKHRKSDF